MKYSKKFTPRIGDRVFYNHFDLERGRIVSILDEEFVIVKQRGCSDYYKTRISELIFRKECPWYFWWQK